MKTDQLLDSGLNPGRGNIPQGARNRGITARSLGVARPCDTQSS